MQTVKLMLLGPQQTGKSTIRTWLINPGNPFEVGELEQLVEPLEGKFQDYKVTVFDIPGLGEDPNQDENVRKELKKLCKDKSQSLNCVCLVLNAKNPSVRKHARRVIANLKHSLGSDVFSGGHFIAIYTHTLGQDGPGPLDKQHEIVCDSMRGIGCELSKEFFVANLSEREDVTKAIDKICLHKLLRECARQPLVEIDLQRSVEGIQNSHEDIYQRLQQQIPGLDGKQTTSFLRFENASRPYICLSIKKTSVVAALRSLFTAAHDSYFEFHLKGLPENICQDLTQAKTTAFASIVAKMSQLHDYYFCEPVNEKQESTGSCETHIFEIYCRCITP